jgi:hypothetical protein
MAANSGRSPERMITLGTECKASKRAVFSEVKPAQESVTASCPQREVKGTEVTKNLKVDVVLT